MKTTQEIARECAVDGTKRLSVVIDPEHDGNLFFDYYAVEMALQAIILAALEVAKAELSASRDGGEQMSPPICKKCGGTGSYCYDHNHGKPCEVCCKHNQGWWELTEHHSGYMAGADNGCCRAGCGQLRRELATGEKL